MKRVYLSPPHLTGHEKPLVDDAFASNWVAPLGPHVDAFEVEVGRLLGVSHAAALSSGTAALHLAMRLLGVGPGDEVLCSSFTFSASANPIVYEGGRPVFVDCDASWTIDPNLVEDELRAAAAAGRRPKALVAVDLYGQTCDYEALEGLCEKYGVPLVEDAAEALGATCRGKAAGSFGKAGVLSFNGNKIITTSGGGMLLSNDRELIRKARFLATQARDAAPHYEHSEIGFNYRMSNVLAALGRGQLATLGERVAARRANFEAYRAALGDLPGIGFMPEAPWGVSNRWLTCVTVDPAAFRATREDVRLALEAENIEARPVWKPMHLQPVFAGCRALGGDVSGQLFAEGLCLPSGSSLAEADRGRVIDVVRMVGTEVRS
ncbi:MAG: aminotransferase class I/II-fold pyridoxal phosphate-dependent enzyme [Thermoanaerobaculia bacterium]